MASQEENRLAQEFVDKRRLLILSLYESKGLKASGLSGQLLQSRREDNKFQIVDQAGYFEFQEFGRASGKAPPFQSIYQWLAYQKYGLKWKDEAQRKQMAWAIVAKIKRSGTLTYRTKPTGVISESINEQLINEFMEKLGAVRATEIATDISRLLK